jgi:UDP-N-acetylmuramate--alanine ligase
LKARNIQIIRFGVGADAWQVQSKQTDHLHEMSLSKDATTYRFNLAVPGSFNAMNVAGAVLMAQALGVSYPDIGATLEAFKGIWRRFEFLGEQNGALIYSDYGHHPTAVAATLQAVKESFPERRVVLCFEPHHRNRTRAFFADFVPSFDLADVLMLSEIYEVAGRDAVEDQKISSQDLIRAVTEHDGKRGVSRAIEYAPDPNSAVRRTLELSQPNDVVIFMGAGDIDEAVRKNF